MKVHPKGTRARVLLTSVFGPYAQDDRFGSRAINPMELYHNQVTREQGAWSPRLFHRSWGLMMIQENISAPSTLLDFPTRKDFERELQAHRYDVIGISSIIVNVGRWRRCAGWRGDFHRTPRLWCRNSGSGPVPALHSTLD